ncbi:hypothetical protein OH491_24765 [Termitidicoccus mucosus]|uniref:Uncharacterized protein n=1 Tax=Termitidicoccus mucosus TaxID=1184151 RepID=A0A178IQM1_9BACT|nr:hypothetical protein AW736_01760 [Opitutaceae bacterium TSB47]
MNRNYLYITFSGCAVAKPRLLSTAAKGARPRHHTLKSTLIARIGKHSPDWNSVWDWLLKITGQNDSILCIQLPWFPIPENPGNGGQTRELKYKKLTIRWSPATGEFSLVPAPFTGEPHPLPCLTAFLPKNYPGEAMGFQYILNPDHPALVKDIGDTLEFNPAEHPEIHQQLLEEFGGMCGLPGPKSKTEAAPARPPAPRAPARPPRQPSKHVTLHPQKL